MTEKTTPRLHALPVAVAMSIAAIRREVEAIQRYLETPDAVLTDTEQIGRWLHESTSPGSHSRLLITTHSK